MAESLNQTFLICDSGGSKLKWIQSSYDGKFTNNIETTGMNPFFFEQKQITDAFEEQLIPHLKDIDSIKELFYYGAGCSHTDNKAKISGAIKTLIPKIDKIFVETDLLGTARGLCGHSKGIACIMGTGSSACLFDGVNIISAREGLGFSLGDEGSGSHLGKILLREYDFNRMDSGIRTKFVEKYGKLTRDEILTNVYKKPNPNQYCASFAPFCSENIDHPYIYNLVKSSFNDFMNISIDGFVDTSDDKNKVTINFTGSIAVTFKNILTQLVEERGLILGSILKDPTEGIHKYHVEEK